MQLRGTEKIPHPYFFMKCNNCGELIEGGLFAIIEHQGECKAYIEVNTGRYTLVYTNPISVSHQNLSIMDKQALEQVEQVAKLLEQIEHMPGVAKSFSPQAKKLV